MEKAKQAVSGFMSKAGHHDTSVHERVAPAVTNETINEQRHEERQIATDREVHQDHYHTSVQPVHDREVLPEQHHHKMMPVEHRTHDHRDHDTTKNTLQQEAAQFRDTSVRAAPQHTSTAAPTVVGEHVHHHVHETIQPVVHKETIEAHVHHTTVPVHEVHHNEVKHHAGSALPAVSMADFKKGGGSLTGRDERTDQFAGEPKSIERALGGGSHTGHGHHSGSGLTGTGATGTGLTGTGTHGEHHHGHNTGTTGGIGSHSGSGLGSNTGSGLGSNTGSGLGSNTGTGLGSNTGTGLGSNTGTGLGSNTGTGLGSSTDRGYGSGHNSQGVGAGVLDNQSGSSTGTTKKPSMMDKLNPMKDSNGDGQKGFMK